MILQKLDSNQYANKIKYIVGDFNQDCQNLIDSAHSHGFAHLESALSCNIITLDISDHLATHMQISLGSSILTSRINTAQIKQAKSEFRMFNELTMKNSKC